MNCRYLTNRYLLTLPAILIFVVLGASCTTVVPHNNASRSFDAQKGKLPWPSEGKVVEPFGTLVNPVYGTKAKNPGILIATDNATAVSSVYAGKVEEIYMMPVFGRVITISHGDYTTVYGNMSEVYVTEGVRVQAGEYIGHAGTENEPKGEALFFAIFQNGVESNPERWLKRK